MRPLIGITGVSRDVDSYVGRVKWEGASTAYVRAVQQAGGAPAILPITREESPAAVLLDRLDGIVFTGGGDIDPALYGQQPAAEVLGVDPDRDRFEYQLLLEAWRRAIPVLAICRGMQLLNVAFGGTLSQHLAEHPTHMDVTIAHQSAHTVTIDPASLLARVVGNTHLKVNSMHHQAADKVAASLRACAWGGDGVVEALEIVGRDDVLGIQWHPELMAQEDAHLALFRWLVTTAARRERLAPGEGEPACVGMNRDD